MDYTNDLNWCNSYLLGNARPLNMSQIIIVCDDQGIPTGEYIPKKEGITGEGKKHLAVSVLLINGNNEVLLQKRKHLVFDNLWDLTASTDLSHFENKDESLEEAADRCLKREYDINNINGLKKLGGFSYFAPYHTVQGDFCENEYDIILTGEYDGEVKMNPEVGYEYKWVDKEEFLKDIDQNPQNYTPWAIEGVKVLKQKGFFVK